MSCERKSLIDLICEASREIGDVLWENELTETEDLHELCYEALSEIFPGGGRKIIQRSKVWRIIQASLNGGKNSEISSRSSSVSSSPSPPSLKRSCLPTSKACSSPSQTSSPCSSKELSIDTLSDVEFSPIAKAPKTPSSPLLISSMKPSPRANSLPNFLKPVERPSYMVYSDPALVDAGKKGSFTKPEYERLIRGTISNMMSASTVPPFNRYPSSAELEEMSKSLIVVYPFLRDAETGHGVVLKSMKRRLSNKKPVNKPQGPTPKKRKYVSTETDAKKVEPKEKEGVENLVKDDADGIDDDSPESPVDGQAIMERHYMGLLKEMEKKNPNPIIINSFLNKEFSARRAWLTNLSSGERVEKLMEKYPCFQDHVEVIEEARRVIGIEAGNNRCKFKDDCLERLTEEVETIIYYGIDSKGLSPPKSPKPSSKMMHVLQNLSVVFVPKKAGKKNMELVHQLKEHEDSDHWCSRRSGTVPALLVEKKKCYIVVGKRILSEVDLMLLGEAIIALLATFYLMDLDYPRTQELGLSVLQHIILKDTNVPEDIAAQFKTAMDSYNNFKDDMQ